MSPAADRALRQHHRSAQQQQSAPCGTAAEACTSHGAGPAAGGGGTYLVVEEQRGLGHFDEGLWMRTAEGRPISPRRATWDAGNGLCGGRWRPSWWFPVNHHRCGLGGPGQGGPAPPPPSPGGGAEVLEAPKKILVETNRHQRRQRKSGRRPGENFGPITETGVGGPARHGTPRVPSSTVVLDFGTSGHTCNQW